MSSPHLGRCAFLLAFTALVLQGQTNVDPCSGLRDISRWHAQISGSITTDNSKPAETTQTISQSGTLTLDMNVRQSTIDPNGSDYTFFGSAIGTANIANSDVVVDPYSGKSSISTTTYSGPLSYPFQNSLDNAILGFQAGANGTCTYLLQFPVTVDGVTFTIDNQFTNEHRRFTSFWDWFLLGVAPLPIGQVDTSTFFVPPLIVGAISVSADGTIQPVSRHIEFPRPLGGVPLRADVEWSLSPGPPEDLDEATIKAPLTLSPPDPDARTYVTKSGELPSPKCLFRSQGPIKFNIDVGRYLGELNSDGTLKYANELITQGMLSPTAKFQLTAYDVDSSASPTATRNPEKDRVLFNGEQVGFLTGSSDSWALNTFEVDIRKVRFAQRAAIGSSPDPASNEITIEVDTANPTSVRENWCTAIGWGAVSVKAMSPILLVHGNGAEKRGYGEYFKIKGFTDALDDARLPYDYSVRLESGPIQVNGINLAKQIPGIIKSFGAESAHVIAHSKGGLDVRDYLAIANADTTSKSKILSLVTIATPHMGSISAEAVSLARDGIPTIFSGLTGILQTIGSFGVALGGFNNGLPFVTPSQVEIFNELNLPNLPSDINYHTVLADADQNGSGSIDQDSEWIALKPDVPFQIIANAAYQLLRSHSALKVFPNLLTGGFIAVGVVSDDPIENDTAVQLPSQRGDSGFSTRVLSSIPFFGPAGRNHASILDTGVAQQVLPLLVRSEQTRGDLK